MSEAKDVFDKMKRVIEAKDKTIEILTKALEKIMLAHVRIDEGLVYSVAIEALAKVKKE